MSAGALREEIHKRLTLNWLIQGAAQHAGMTFHHLIREELNALDPRLIRLYDQFGLTNLLQYWQPDVALIFGWPRRFWRRAATDPRHPFFGHSLLSRFGGMLAESGRERALARCREKGITSIPILFSFQTVWVVQRLNAIESPHRAALTALAKRAASTIWGIPENRLDGQIGKITAFGTPIRVRNGKAALLRSSIVGLGGVVQRGKSLVVVGRGTNWQLLTKELVKGTAELICLHGLNRLSEEMYREVVGETDRLEWEPWMLQTGGELWRRLLPLMPDDRPVAEVFMHMARLSPGALESLVGEVIEDPEGARRALAACGVAGVAGEGGLA